MDMHCWWLIQRENWLREDTSMSVCLSYLNQGVWLNPLQTSSFIASSSWGMDKGRRCTISCTNQTTPSCPRRKSTWSRDNSYGYFPFTHVVRRTHRGTTTSLPVEMQSITMRVLCRSSGMQKHVFRLEPLFILLVEILLEFHIQIQRKICMSQHMVAR
jgi:hypothetical protein